MYINNTNSITLSASDLALAASFVKVYTYTVEDIKVSELTIVLQFGIYSKAYKFIQNWRDFDLKVSGINIKKLTLTYNRQTDGGDIEAFIYDKVKAELMLLFPEWDETLLVIVDY